MADRRKTRLISDDKKYIWHPFTQMADWAKDDPSTPLAIKSAKGVWLYDEEGNKYLDGVSSLWVTVHGHRHPDIDAAIRAQLAKVAHTTFLGLTHEPAVELAKRLVKMAPGKLARVFYSDNGSTSVEIALKMAYQYWVQKTGSAKRKTFLSLRNAYHGDTLGSVSVGGMDLFHAKFKPLLFTPHFARSPYCYRCPDRTKPVPAVAPRAKTYAAHCKATGCKGQCLKDMESILATHGESIAAAVVEPMVQGAAGMLTMPAGYLKGVEKLCRKYKVLLICDEVATGFGRTGKMFACEHEKISPDLLCLSKGITGGYLPLAATLATEAVYEAFLGRFEEFKTFFHGHTYTANPLACAAAIASLDVFKKEQTLADLPGKTDHFARALGTLADNPWVGEIRQIGLMAGVELVKDRATGQEFPAKDKIGAKVCAACRKHGLIIRPLGDTIVFMPPLAASHNEYGFMVGTVRKAITEVLGIPKKR